MVSRLDCLADKATRELGFRHLPCHSRVTHSRNQTLLSLVKRTEEPKELAREIALQAAADIALRLAFSRATSDVVSRPLVVATAAEDDHVQRRVQLPVAAVVKAIAHRLA